MKYHPDVVVIDTMLPMIDGLGVIEKCREKLSDKDMPSFIVTTFIGTQKLIECINHMEVDYCIMKPFQPGYPASQDRTDYKDEIHESADSVSAEKRNQRQQEF